MEVVRKARRALYPRHKLRAAVEIEDSVVDSGKIYLLVRPEAVEKDPQVLLDNYLQRKPQYPSIERWAIEQGFGSTRVGNLYHCRVIGTEKQQRKKVEQVVDRLGSLTKEQQAELLARMQKKSG